MPHELNEPTRPYSVRTRKLERRYRAGHCFGLVAVAVALTAAQAQLVMADPELVCNEVPAPEPSLEVVPNDAAAPAAPEEVPTQASEVTEETEVPAKATDGVKPKAKAGK